MDVYFLSADSPDNLSSALHSIVSYFNAGAPEPLLRLHPVLATRISSA